MNFSKYYFYKTYYKLGSDILNKLPSIFHTSSNFITNNKKSFVNYKENNHESNNRYDLINYFNKEIVVVLKSGKEIRGVLISKRNNYILLNTSDYINIKDIMEIK